MKAMRMKQVFIRLVACSRTELLPNIWRTILPNTVGLNFSPVYGGPHSQVQPTSKKGLRQGFTALALLRFGER